MKNPLHYQLSEYDCGPTSLLNAISFLFEREEIPPEILRNIMLYCLDCYGPEGSAGKSGTSCTAMMFLSNWLQGLGDIGKLPVSICAVRMSMSGTTACFSTPCTGAARLSCAFTMR